MSRFNWAIILSCNSIILLTLPIRRRPMLPVGSGKRHLSDKIRIWLKEDSISCQPLRKLRRIPQVSVWPKNVVYLNRTRRSVERIRKKLLKYLYSEAFWNKCWVEEQKEKESRFGRHANKNERGSERVFQNLQFSLLLLHRFSVGMSLSAILSIKFCVVNAVRSTVNTISRRVLTYRWQ